MSFTFTQYKNERKDTIKFDSITVNKKEFYKSKQPVISDKFKHSDESFKYLIGHKESEIVKPLCIILPQMTKYIKKWQRHVFYD